MTHLVVSKVFYDYLLPYLLTYPIYLPTYSVPTYL